MKRPSDERQLAEFLGWLSQSNPFYSISAVLVMLGIHALIHDPKIVADPQSAAFNGPLMLGMLAGYALLLAGASILIVRVGRVWNDARTILLTLLLLFVASSIDFDTLLLRGDLAPPVMMAVSLGFTSGLTETLLVGLGIRLPWRFRIPLHLFLALFAGYPAGLAWALDEVGGANNMIGRMATIRGLAGFTWAAGLVTLTLLPAVFAGPDLVRRNGTPWTWPLFPWSIFALLVPCVFLRAWYLGFSFQPAPGVKSGFGLYLLAPWLAAMGVVLFELLSRAGRRSVANAALTLAGLAILGTIPSVEGSRAYEALLRDHATHVGSPLVIGTTLACLLAGYALLRGVPLAEFALGLTGTLWFLTRADDFGWRDVNLAGRGVASLWSLTPLGVVVLVGLIRRPTSSFRWTLLVLAGLLFLGGSPNAAWRVSAVPLVLAGTVWTGLAAALFRDPFATALRLVATLAAGPGGLLAAFVYTVRYASETPLGSGDHSGPVAVTLSLLAVLAAMEQWLWRQPDRSPLAPLAALGAAAAWLRWFQPSRGPLLIAVGLVSFVVALVISLRKGVRASPASTEAEPKP